MQTLNSLKQSKYIKHLVVTGTLIFLTIIYSVFPQKEYFTCQDKNIWSDIKTTVVIRSYAFGIKHSVNEFNLFQCETNSNFIYCGNSFGSIEFDRITADYDIFEPSSRLYRCQKTKLQI